MGGVNLSGLAALVNPRRGLEMPPHLSGCFTPTASPTPVPLPHHAEEGEAEAAGVLRSGGGGGVLRGPHPGIHGTPRNPHWGGEGGKGPHPPPRMLGGPGRFQK